MKPNGRRRFRKMNARFRQRGSAVVRERARATSAGKARKLILNDFWGGDPQPLPPPVFSPRSLVGMSQRRRKQLYHQLFDAQTDPETIYSGTWSQGGLHVGERIRPCLGCLACRSGWSASDSVLHSAWNRTRCDGSGVIPARSQVNPGKALAVEPAQNP